MKVIFAQQLPFFLAHGGAQTVTVSVMRELRKLGVDVEAERWWDEDQRGDILHFVGRPSSAIYVRLAHQKGFKTVMTEFLDQASSRTRAQAFGQRLLIRAAQRFLGGLVGRLAWDVYRELDAMIYCTPHEWQRARYLFDASPGRGHYVPHGLDEDAIAVLSQRAPEGDYLVSISTITARKNSILLARAARRARVPVLFLGRPYSEDDPYFLQFRELVDGENVRYGGFVSEDQKREHLRGARGFALLSQFESGCVAVYEAAAAGLPLFLSNLPWAAKAYTEARQARFVDLGDEGGIARALSAFYQSAHRLEGVTFPILSWGDVAKRYLEIYQGVLGLSR